MLHFIHSQSCHHHHQYLKIIIWVFISTEGPTALKWCFLSKYDSDDNSLMIMRIHCRDLLSKDWKPCLLSVSKLRSACGSAPQLNWTHCSNIFLRMSTSDAPIFELHLTSSYWVLNCSVMFNALYFVALYTLPCILLHSTVFYWIFQCTPLYLTVLDNYQHIALCCIFCTLHWFTAGLSCIWSISVLTACNLQYIIHTSGHTTC